MPSYPADRNKSLYRFALFLVVGMASAVVYHGVLNALGFDFPWNTFLFNPRVRHSDWFLSVAAAATHNPYIASGRGAYFPFAYLAILAGDMPNRIVSMAVFEAIAALLMGAGLYLFWRASFARDRVHHHSVLTLASLTVIAAFSYPFWFALDRGNIDLWVAGLCLIYIAELRADRSWIGPVALGMAIALKGYPLALVLLGLRQRRYKEVAVSIAIAIGLTLFSLAQFHSSIAASWRGFHEDMQGFWLENVIGSASLFGTSDPYNGLRALAWIGLHAYRQFFTAVPLETADLRHFDPHVHAKFLKAVAGGSLLTGPRILFAGAYGALTTFGAAVTSFYVLLVAESLWRRVLTMALVAILYPNLAGDYKLLMLLPAIFTILADPQNGNAQTRALCLLALLMIPKSYLYFYGISINMLINPVLLLALWWTMLWEPQAWRAGIANFRTRLRWYLAGPGVKWDAAL